MALGSAPQVPHPQAFVFGDYSGAPVEMHWTGLAHESQSSRNNI